MNPTRLRITGGPSPVDITATIDGKKAESVSRIELVLDVNDAVRAKVTYVSQVVFDGDAHITTGHIAALSERLSAPGGELGDVVWVTTHTGAGFTRAEALRDLADQLDAEERKRASAK